jgi:rhamnosyl/mannosyltransferase
MDLAQVAAIRARYGPQPLLLFVGRLRYYKGLPYLFEALQRVDARLLVVGSGPLAAEWRALAAQLGLADRVLFLGEVPDAELHALYHAAQVFVLPASHRSEAFGTVQLEAMAAGCPVVSTELGTGTSYVNQHGITGFVVPPRDPAALAEAISRLLGNADLRSHMGSAARARVAAVFTAAHMVEQVIALYQTLGSDELMRCATS